MRATRNHSSNMSSNSSVAGDTAEISTPSTPSNFSHQGDINGPLTTPSAPSAAGKKRKRNEDDDTSEPNADQVTNTAHQDSTQPTNQPQAAIPPQPANLQQTINPPHTANAPQPANQAPAANGPSATVVDLTADDDQPRKKRKLDAPFVKCKVTLKWWEQVEGDYEQKVEKARVALSLDKKTVNFWERAEDDEDEEEQEDPYQEPYFNIQTASIKNLDEAQDDKELILTRDGEKTLNIIFELNKYSRDHGKFFNVVSPLGNNGKGTDRLQKERAEQAARETINTTECDALFMRNQWQKYGNDDWREITKNQLKQFCRWVNEKDPTRPLQGTSNMTKPDIQQRIIQWLKANPNEGLPAGAASTAQPQYEAKVGTTVLGYYWTKNEAKEVMQKAIFGIHAANVARRDGGGSS